MVSRNSEPTADEYEGLATFTRQLERELAELATKNTTNMNSFKTELFKISFEETTGQDQPCVTITHVKSDWYLGFFTLASLCIEVDGMLQDGAIDAEEAIMIIRKSASFFIHNGK